MIDAILFDLGDTIINFGIGRREAEGLFHAGARQTYDYLASRGKALPAYERYFQSHYRKMRNEYLWSKLVCRDFDYGDALATVLRRMRVSVSQEERCQIEWMWYDPIMRVSHIDAGLHDMLAELRDSGTKMGIVSNTFVPGHCLDRHLEETGLLEFFPVRVYSSGVRYRKPHPRIFEIALGRVGVEAGRTVFIGDLRGPDIRGAQRAGMKTVWKPAANAAVGRGAHGADRMIKRITQLPEILPLLGWRRRVGRAETPAAEGAVGAVGVVAAPAVVAAVPVFSE